MALLDRFRRLPQWKSDDPLVRIAGVEELPLDQQDVLLAIAREDGDARVRRAAVRKIIDPALVAETARTDRDETVREEAAGILRDLALGVFENTTEAESHAALALLQDLRDVITVAESASLESVWRAAIARLDDPKALGAVARRASLPAARLEALQRLADPVEVSAVALKSEHKDVALAAVERITDRDALKLVSAKAAAKAAGRRARALLDTLEARERPAAEAPSPEALAAQAAKARQVDLCRQVESLARSALASAELSARIRQSEELWGRLAGEPDPGLARRFAIATQAAQGLLERVETDEGERSRLAEATAAAVSVRTALCERFEAADANDAPRALEEARAAWRALAPMPPGQEARALAVTRRFEEAAAACEQRHGRAVAAMALAERAGRVCEEADRVAKSPRFPEAGPQWASVARAWREVVAAGFAGEDLAARFSRAEERFRGHERSAREQEGRRRQASLERLQRQLARIEGLLASPALSLKDAERSLRDLRGTLDVMPVLPQKQDHDDMVRRMKDLHAALVPKVQELREIDEWQRWANVGIQEQLCQRAEAMAGIAEVAEVARQLREIQEEWKKASLVPHEKAQALWTRFRAATEQARARCDAYFAQQAEERGRNLARKEAICQQVEATAGSTDWIKTAEAIKALQAEWKGIGPVPRGQEQAVWERFRQACDRFFTRRHEDLARRKEEWAANLARKQALCERIEALETVTDWELGMSEVKRAQVEWKAIGPVRKSRTEAIWQRFRSACDSFFERFRERSNTRLAAERSEREALLSELEALAPVSGEPEPTLVQSGAPAVESDATTSVESEAAAVEVQAATVAPPPPDDLADRVIRNRIRWLDLEHAEHPGRATWAPLNERYQTALERVLDVHGPRFKETALDPDASRRAMIGLCEQVEKALATVRPTPGVAASPAAVLAQQLREALAANTIGGRAAAAEVEEKWQAAEAQIKNARAAWQTLGPVPGEAGRALARRFQHACRRFGEQRDRQLRPPPHADGPATPGRGLAADRRER